MIRSHETGRFRSRAVAGVAFVLALSGCTAGSPSAVPSPVGSSTQAPSSPTPTGSPQPIPSTTASPAVSPASPPITSSSAVFDLLPVSQPADFVPTITCDGSIGPSDPVAIARLRAAEPGTGDVVLRDYADTANPTTACTFGQNVPVQLIDARHVVIGGSSPGAYAVVDLPDTRYHWFQLPGIPDTRSSLIAVAPGLDEVAWRSQSADGVQRQIHITDAQGDHMVAALPPVQGGRCGSPDDSKQGAYSNSGNSLYVLDQPIISMNVLMVFSGTTTQLSVAPPESGWPDAASAPAMAVWSPLSETLYYRQHGDVWRLSPGSDPEQFLPDVAWYQPTITADGRHLVYLAEGGTYLVDLAADPSPQLIPAGGVGNVFLNSTQLWFLAPAPGGCAAFPDEPMVYNIEDSSLAPSVIDQVFYVWPATSSNH